MTDPDRLPPQDLDAEQVSLGAILLDGDFAGPAGIAILDIDDFYREAHRFIYESILAVNEAGEPVDIITVAAELRRRGLLEKVGGGEYLTALIGHVPTAAHIKRYAGIVHEKGILRRLILAGGDIQALAYANPADVQVALGAATDILEEIQMDAHRNGVPRKMSDGAPEAQDRMEARRNRAYDVGTARFGIDALDKKTGGLEDAGYCVLLGNTGQGKTGLLVQIVVATAWQIDAEVGAKANLLAAARRGNDDESIKRARDALEEAEQKCIIVFGMEEGMWRWHLRMASYVGGFDSRVCRNKPTFEAAQDYHADLEQTYWKAFSDVAGLRVEFGEDEQTISSIWTHCTRISKHRKPVLVAIDYLQRMGHNDKRKERVEQLSDIGVRLRRLADRLRCPVLATSQVTIGPEGRPVTKDSKALEDSADTAIEIRRMRNKITDKSQEDCTLICRKSKEFSDFGTFKVHTDFKTGRWSESDRTEEPEDEPLRRTRSRKDNE